MAVRRQQCARQQCQARKRVPFRAKASLYRHGPRRVRIRRGETREECILGRRGLKEPSAANEGLLYEVSLCGNKISMEDHQSREQKRTSICNPTHRNSGQCLQCNRNGVCKGYISISDLLFRRGQNMDKLAVSICQSLPDPSFLSSFLLYQRVAQGWGYMGLSFLHVKSCCRVRTLQIQMEDRFKDLDSQCLDGQPWLGLQLSDAD